MSSDRLVRIRREILGDLLKCSFCGLCEWVCPTQKANGNRREYGPRGRVNTIVFILRNEGWDIAMLNSLYSCLLCKACTTQCPAGINIPESVRLFRYYIREKKLM